MAALTYWIWLSSVEAGPRAKAVMLEHFGDPEHAFFAPKGAFEQLDGVNQQEAAVFEQRDLSRVDEILSACEEQDLRVITLQDAAYPQRLRSIYAPPPVLFVQGKLPELDREAVFCVIGTRKPSFYGRKMGRDLAWQICRGGGVTVSLLVGGVDAEATRASLLAEGSCIGVLGTPHEEAHGELAEELRTRGALISEYPPGMPGQKHFFRERNRIASGISCGVVVVEAPPRSGTIPFAEQAAEQGREIFAVPGNADAENSRGTLELIQSGARLVTCGWDVLRDFAPLYPGKLRDPGRGAPTLPLPKREDEAAAPEKNEVDREKGRDYIDLREQLADLPVDQLAILTAIDKGSTHVDDIIAKTGLPTWAVLKHMTLLTIRGYVKKDPGNFYRLNLSKK